MKKVLLSLGAFLFAVAGWAQAWQDVTATYVKNAGMTENANTQTAWTMTGLTDNGPKDGYNIYGFYSGWGSLERTAGSATQEITLPAGNYKLTGYGFFRDGVAYNTNPTVSLGYMFAGDTELLLPTLGSVEGLNSYADNFPGGSDAFYNQNLYLNELEFSMADEGTIAIGFRCTFERKQSWMLIGKMTLYKEMSYAEMFEAKKANLNALLEELDGITVYSTTIPATMTEAETVMAGEDKEAQLRMLDSLETLYTKAQVLLPKAKEAHELLAACQTMGGSTTEKADGAKDALDNALTAAKADLAQADTNESMDQAMDGIEAARRNYLLQALPAEGETLDFTFLIDGIGNSTNGWVREFVNFSHNYQYQNASNKNNGDLQKTGYIEAWNNGVEFTGTLTYTATELPIGRYNISAYTFQAANDTVMLFANDKSVELDHGTELYTLSKVEDVAVNGTLSLGLDMAKGATWTGITNIRLEYVGQLDAATTYAAFQAAYKQLKVYADGSLNTALNADVKAMTDSYADMDQTDVTAMEMAYIALTAKAKELQTLSGLYADVKAAYEAAEAEAGNSTETAEGAKAMFEAALEAQAAALDAATTAEELNAVAEAVETARQAYVVNARPNVGCTLDYTFKIVNPSFETGDLTGWTATTANDTGVKPNSNGTYTINNADGNYVFNTWGGTAEKDVQQTVTGLPAGVYSLTVLLASDAGISVNVTAGSVTNTFTLSKDKANGEDFSVENVTVGEDGQLLVKVASNDWYKVDNFRLNRAADAIDPMSSYTRNGLTPGHYGTICLPYAVAAGDYEGAEFFTVAGCVKENGIINSIVLEAAESLEAGIPYIFCATGDELTATYNGEAVENAKASNGLVGSFSGTDVSEGMYLLTADNTVRQVGENGGHIAEHHAYFDLTAMPEYKGETAGVNLRIIHLNDATDVSALKADGKALVDVFTLSGVKVRSQVPAREATNGLPRGIYIVNQQKITVH